MFRGSIGFVFSALLAAQPPAALTPDPATHPVVTLWPQGAPGSEGKTGEETFRVEGRDRLVVAGVHRPSLTVYLPPEEKASGAAVIVMPGGSFRELWITHEGYRVAEWLSRRGIAAFVLKYRLARETGSSYSTERESLADVQRAVRTVRARAAEWRVNPDRVGVMGFSAGGMLAGLAGTRYGQEVYKPADAADRLSAKPAFQALVYGSPFSPPMKLDAVFSKETPPAFLVAGSSDSVAEGYPDVFKLLKEKGVSVELHLYAGIGHGFGIQPGTPLAVSTWIERFYDWLFELGMLAR